MKIIYIGCVQSSYIILQELISIRANIVGVITKEKSSFNSDFRNLKELAEDNAIPYIYVTDINEKGAINFIKAKDPDIGFCFGWSQIIKQPILNLFSKGMLGFHPAKLPFNKGRHPIIWALALGLKETASTFFYLKETADAGNIVSQKQITIEYEDDAQTLYDKVMQNAKEQIIEIYHNLQINQLVGLSQPNVGNIWRKRDKEDGKIDWRMSSEAIYNLVRALTHPYIGAHFIYKNKEYKVWKVKVIKTDQYKNIESGKIIKVKEDGTFYVKAYDYIISVIDYSENFQPKENLYL